MKREECNHWQSNTGTFGPNRRVQEREAASGPRGWNARYTITIHTHTPALSNSILSYTTQYIPPQTSPLQLLYSTVCRAGTLGISRHRLWGNRRTFRFPGWLASGLLRVCRSRVHSRHLSPAVCRCTIGTAPRRPLLQRQLQPREIQASGEGLERRTARRQCQEDVLEATAGRLSPNTTLSPSLLIGNVTIAYGMPIGPTNETDQPYSLQGHPSIIDDAVRVLRRCAPIRLISYSACANLFARVRDAVPSKERGAYEMGAI